MDDDLCAKAAKVAELQRQHMKALQTAIKAREESDRLREELREAKSDLDAAVNMLIIEQGGISQYERWRAGMAAA